MADQQQLDIENAINDAIRQRAALLEREGTIRGGQLETARALNNSIDSASLDSYSESVDGMTESLNAAADASDRAGTSTQNMTSAIEESTESSSGFFSMMGSGLSALAGLIGSVLISPFRILGGIFGTLYDAASAFFGLFFDAARMIVAVLKAPFDMLMGLVNIIGNVLVGAINFLKSAFDATIGLIVSALRAPFDMLMGLVNIIKNVFVGALNVFKRAWNLTFGAITAIIMAPFNLMQKFLGLFGGGGDGINTKGFVAGVLGAFAIVKNAIQGATKVVKQFFSLIYTTGQSVMAIINPVRMAFGEVLNNLQEMANEYARDGLMIADAFERIRADLGDLSTGAGADAVQTFKNIRTSIQSGAIAGVSFAKVFGAGPDGIAAAIQYSGELIKQLGPAVDRFSGDVANAADQAFLAGKALGFTGEDLANIGVIAGHTGETFRESLTRINTEVGTLSKQFGVNTKEMGRNLSVMMKSPGVFGTSTREMIKTSIAAQKLGVSIDALKGPMGVFDDFESGAKAAAELASEFGILVDSQALMSAEPAEQALMLKDALAASGQEYANLSRQEKARISELTGINANDLTALMDPNNAFDLDAFGDVENEVDAATQATMDQAAATQQLVKQMEKLNKIYDESKTGGMFSNFVQGIETAMFRSKEFRHVLRLLNNANSAFLRAGKQVGYMLAELFGKQGPFKFVTEYFEQAYNLDKISAMLKGFTDAFRTFVDALKNNDVNALGNLLRSLFDAKQLGPSVDYKALFMSFMDALDLVFANLINAIPFFTKKIAEFITSLSDKILAMIGPKSPEKDALFGQAFMGKTIAAITDVFTDPKTFGALLTAITGLFDALVKAAPVLYGKVRDILKGIFKGGSEEFKGDGEAKEQTTNSVFGFFEDILTSAMNAVTELAPLIIGGITELVNNFAAWLQTSDQEAMGSTTTAFGTAFKNMFETLFGTEDSEGLLPVFWKSFKSMVGVFWDKYGEDIWAEFKSGLQWMVNKAFTALGDMLSGGLVSGVQAFAGGLVNAVISGIKNAFSGPGLAGMLGSVITGVAGILNSGESKKAAENAKATTQQLSKPLSEVSSAIEDLGSTTSLISADLMSSAGLIKTALEMYSSNIKIGSVGVSKAGTTAQKALVDLQTLGDDFYNQSYNLSEGLSGAVLDSGAVISQLQSAVAAPLLDVAKAYNEIGEELGDIGVIDVNSMVKNYADALKIDNEQITVKKGNVNVTINLNVAMKADELSQVLVEGQYVAKGTEYDNKVDLDDVLFSGA